MSRHALLDESEQNAMLRAKWKGMKTAVSTGDINAKRVKFAFDPCSKSIRVKGRLDPFFGFLQPARLYAPAG